MLRVAVLILAICLYGAGPASAQKGATQTPPQPGTKSTEPARPQDGAVAAGEEKLTDAERIVRLRRTIEENEKRLKELNDKLNEPEGEHFKAEAEFRTLDQDLEAKKKELQKLTSEGRTDQAAALQSEVDALTQRWKLAKDRFDLAIRERKTLQEQIVALEQKSVQDRDALSKLLALPTTQPAPGAAPAPPTTTPVQPSGPPGAQPGPVEPAAPPAAQPTPPAAPSAAPSGAPAGAAPADGGPAQPPSPPPAEPTKPPSKELLKAQEEAQAKAEKAIEAEKEAESISARIEQVRKQIELEKKELQTLRDKAENADQTRRTLNDLVQKRSAEGAPQAELQELWSKIADARQRSRAAQDEANKKVDRIDQLQDDLHVLQAEHIGALEEAEGLRREADQAQRGLDELNNPLSPRNLLQWVLIHSPRLIGIVVGMFVLLWLARFAEHRFVKVIAGRGGPGTELEREARAKTLVSVFHHAATWVIIIGGILMLLAEVGAPIVPLMGGAAVIGLAAAFGAQNLVRDYFSGFVILLENQYSINDVIKIGDVGGLVERITLRVTVLRGLDGTVHFVPNGQIDKVSNMTHGWSRALFEIGVAYKEDVDRVMGVLVQLGTELRRDSKFGHLILDDPEMLGVDEFADSAVVIKFFIKTRPLQQWTVKRELLRRIKKKFDELDIEIPFPHRTVFHRYEHGEPAAPGTEKGEQMTAGL